LKATSYTVLHFYSRLPPKINEPTDLNDHFQLCAAAMCLEERLGQTILHGEIFYYGNRRREQVEFTEDLRRKTELAIFAAHSAVSEQIPAPITNQKKCTDCSLKSLCLPKEVKKLSMIT
jgi:CRISPR-associated exonuclease Cas4